MFSSPSYAKWTKVIKDINGNTFYVDFDRIRKHGGYVYYWVLIDLLKPNKFSTLSIKDYNQGDCKLFRVKTLQESIHINPMGRETGDKFPQPDKWDYPPPNTVNEYILKKVCSRWVLDNEK